MRDKLNYSKYIDLRDEYKKLVNRLANIRLVMFIGMIISFILKYYYYKFIFTIIFIICFIIFFIMVIVHDKYFKIYDYYIKYVNVLEEYLARENGEWKKFNDKGEDFFNETNFYLNDLDILGNSSLFQYLSVCKTLGGRDRLVKRLSNYECTEELVNNQNIIKELANDIEFCIKFQVMLDCYEGKKIYLSNKSSLYNNLISSRISDLIIGLIASYTSFCLFLLGIIRIIPIGYFGIMFIFNLLITMMYAYIYREDFIKFDKLVNSYSNLDRVFTLVGNYEATSFKMKKIVKNVNRGLDTISKLKRFDNINSLRKNLLSSLLLNGVSCLNLWIMYYYSLFLNKNFKILLDIVGEIEELEADISLAGIGIIKDISCIPEYNDKLMLEFKELKHPLIDEDICISNNFKGNASVNIITGSNMGGKTTFLRTVGINLILMQAGSYVCANDFKASYFKIFTSMRVMDNIDKGISTFYGELLRIKDMIDYNNKGNMLVLIDEIFKGTNYNDRMYGAKEVVYKLNNKNTLAFITTHDFELCESTNVRNFHVKEDYDGDKIIFDYKVRDGKCISTNAKYLMHKLGIVNEE